MRKCDFDDSIEITLRHRCSLVNLLHIQTGKNKKYCRGGAESLQKIFGHHGWLSKEIFQPNIV